jgi:hypothetical protein
LQPDRPQKVTQLSAVGRCQKQQIPRILTEKLAANALLMPFYADHTAKHEKVGEERARGAGSCFGAGMSATEIAPKIESK